MSLTFKIPQTARFISTSSRFLAAFNNPTAGVYDFDTTTLPGNVNTNQVIIPLQPNSVYLIERMSIGADIGEAVYQESLSLPAALGDLLPTLRLSWLRGRGENIYAAPFPITQLIDNQEVAAWVTTSHSNDFLVATFRGTLNQVSATVGRVTINVYVNLSIYQVATSWYNTHFKSQLSRTTGQDLRD